MLTFTSSLPFDFASFRSGQAVKLRLTMILFFSESMFEVLDILDKYNLSPKKRFGQNFLIDKNVLQKIIAAADLKKSDCVLEVGPGAGILTRELIERAQKVVAVEKDRDLASALTQEFSKANNLTIIENDILRFDQEILKKEFNNKKYKIVANLPYNITSNFLRVFLESVYPPAEMILMVQWEVAERICEKVDDLSVLALSIQFYAEPTILFKVSKNSFHPRPKVDSAVIRIANIRSDKFDIAGRQFFPIVKEGFKSKRKKLISNLAKLVDKKKLTEAFSKLNFPETTRAEELNIGNWVELVRLISK